MIAEFIDPAILGFILVGVMLFANSITPTRIKPNIAGSINSAII